MSDSYITLFQEGTDEVIINKSRFIGCARPCETEQQALDFLKTIRERYKDATHHCYAYVIGLNRGIMRYSDDGEPGGTAGLPMMDVIRNSGAVNLCVVVVRYFGGILLGTGGLVRAYTQGCKLGLAAAGLARMEMTKRLLCEVPYSRWDPLQYALRHLPARIENPEFGASISFTLVVRSTDEAMVYSELEKALNREIESLPDTEGFEAWTENG